MNTVKCVHCKEQMKIVKIDCFNKPQGIALMSAGVLFLAAIPLEAVLGFALIPFGAAVAFSKKEAWYCSVCSSYVDRLNPTNPGLVGKLAKLFSTDTKR